MFTMKFVIKMYVSSMKIALHTYFKGSISEVVSMALAMLFWEPTVCAKKKKKNKKPQRNPVRFPALGPHKLGLLI